MTTDLLISKAIHALNTGQPNLSKLYMRKALEQTEQHRREIDPHREARQRLEAFYEGVRGIAQAYIDAVRPAVLQIVEALKPAVNEMLKAQDAAHNPRRADFALVGPGK